MQAGRMRHRITIQQATETQDAAGQPVQTWGAFATVWAERVPLTAREVFAAQQMQSEISLKYRIRHLSGVTAKMRLVDDGVTYEIAGPPLPDNRGRGMTILVKRMA